MSSNTESEWNLKKGEEVGGSNSQRLYEYRGVFVESNECWCLVSMFGVVVKSWLFELCIDVLESWSNTQHEQVFCLYFGVSFYRTVNVGKGAWCQMKWGCGSQNELKLRTKQNKANQQPPTYVIKKSNSCLVGMIDTPSGKRRTDPSRPACQQGACVMNPQHFPNKQELNHKIIFLKQQQHPELNSLCLSLSWSVTTWYQSYKVSIILEGYVKQIIWALLGSRWFSSLVRSSVWKQYAIRPGRQLPPPPRHNSLIHPTVDHFLFFVN